MTYGDPLVREERAGSPDSLELQREQTFTAKDVGKQFARSTYDNGNNDYESEDDQRRRSTDTLRHVEGALEAALESVEDTRALAFAQQFHRDSDSDEDSDDEAEAEDDGYEEDEEDDDEPDYEPDGSTSDYNFQQVLDDLQASDAQLGGSSGFTNDFFDGPFGDMGATPGAPGQSGLAVDGNDLSALSGFGAGQSIGAGANITSPSGGSQIGVSPGVTSGQMNALWNSGMQHLYTAGPHANTFANVQGTGWGSSPGDNASLALLSLRA